ncbi:plasminogen-like [Ruditapes philippinarum]|uniref:plasminogen-like n=1 Tax=Ruditapes philippinarum TaxID=129788 RepID=UPI00295BB21D|nr:plasminogen-like [Ruditapes philippinarum]
MERLYAICFFILFVVEVRIVAADDECFQLGEFKFYTGNKSTTQSGLECQRWDKQTPHEHKYTADKFPEQSLCKAKNYCRDPGGDGFTWCYTTDPDTRWEACGIPWCDEPARNDKIHDCYILTEEDRQHGNTEKEMCESNFNRESVCGNDVPKGCETCDACCQKRDYCCESIYGYNGT